MELFVPGRLCLFGAHSDWAAVSGQVAGRCIALTTRRGIQAEAARATGRLQASPGFAHGPSGPIPLHPSPLDLPFEDAALMLCARRDAYWGYVAGSAAAVLQAHPQVGGAHIRFTETTLPVGRGLSSSAAACVLTVRAFSQLYRLNLSPRQVMELAYAGERLTGSACGRLDQIVAYPPGASLMTFEGESVDIQPLTVGAAFPLLLVDLGGLKDTRRILPDLGACFDDPDHPHHEGLVDYLGPINQHIIDEATRHILRGDDAALGSLMDRVLALFDRHVTPACPEELRAPRLHEVLDDGGLRAFIYGGKGVGSHGDGSAQLLCRSEVHREEAQSYLMERFKMTSVALDLLPSAPPAAGG